MIFSQNKLKQNDQVNFTVDLCTTAPGTCRIRHSRVCDWTSSATSRSDVIYLRKQIHVETTITFCRPLSSFSVLPVESLRQSANSIEYNNMPRYINMLLFILAENQREFEKRKYNKTVIVVSRAHHEI